ncbi:RimI Acetyltransferases [Burkholderiaceae bacterium]
MSNLSFRAMLTADLDAVLLLELASHTHPWTRGNFTDSLAAGHWAYCVESEASNALWAYFILFPAVDELHLLNITVNSAVRQRGIGTCLMTSIENIARQSHYQRIILEVRASNLVAIKLYERLGFEHIGQRKEYYPLDALLGVREDAKVMAKSLKIDTL